ncbi:MAG: caspase family protein [Deltaproteobacteria bacterium]|nr:caspase family protein [Deltaproteobacteria bacterium]
MKRKSTSLILYLMLLVLCLPGIAKAAPEKRTALVIGNGSYDVGPLKNPVNDATDIAATLKRLSFSVTLKSNARLQEMEEAIRDFGRKLKQGGAGLFFYAGHGIQINGRNYLIPIGARIEKETDAKYQAIDAEMVLDEMGNAGNPLNIVILDACRDNPLGRSLRNAGRGLAIISDAPQGTLITFSTSPGKTAADGEGRNSPYTAALIKHMTEPGQLVEQVFKKVRQTLIAQSSGKQIPWEVSSLQGNFVFASGSDRAAAVPPLEKSVIDRAESSVSSVTSVPVPTVASVYEHPGGRFVKSGKGWLEYPPYAPGKNFTFKELRTEGGYLYLYDPSRHKEGDPARVFYLRIPIVGGMSQWSYPNPFNWQDLYMVSPEQ